MKQIPKIDKYMTPMPHTVNLTLPIQEAVSIMREHRIRHLPVLDAGKLVGILTDRDVKLISTMSRGGESLVQDAMTPEPYSVAPHTSLDSVALEMAEHKYGCAVIQQDNGKVVGIFTAVDGLRVLGEILQSTFKPSND